MSGVTFPPTAVSVPTAMDVPHFLGQGRIGRWRRAVPEPGRGELLIEVRANAVCGTDRTQWYGGSDVTPGHEAAGVVARAGLETAIPLGTPGVVYLMDFCGACEACSAGATHRCTAKRGDIGFTRDGGYGRYALVHEPSFFPVDDDLPLDEATLLLDVMGTAGHALRRALHLVDDPRTVLIAGAGPVGLGAVAMCRLLLGPKVSVLVADVVPYRLQLAERLGGEPIELDLDSIGARARAAGRLADLAIDTSGRSSARRACLEALRAGGVLVCVGHGENLTLDVSRDLIAPERAVLGSEYFRRDELPGNLELLRAHRDLFRQIITHRFGIDELAAAYRLFLSGETGKVVVLQ